MKLDYNELLNEINSYGYAMTSPNDIMRIGKDDKILIPTLINWLKKATLVDDKILIVRSLGVKGYSEVSAVLLDEYKASDDNHYKWVIGNTIYNIKDKSIKASLIDIVLDKKNGTSRQMVILALGKMKIEESLPALLDLLKDNQELGHVISALGCFKKPELIEKIRPFVQHDKTLVRNEAKRAIKKLEKLL